MPRIPRIRRLQPLQAALIPSSATIATRAPFAASRAISSTCAARGKNTEWVRGKLWKGEAPGPEDPYTQRLEPEEVSGLPQEATEFQPRKDKTPAAIRASRLTLPPRRTEATAEKELKVADPTYVPATDITELEEIPSLDQWWEQPGHWDQVSEFRGFGNPSKIVEKEVVEVHLRRAVVEVLALQQSGKFGELATQKWSEGSRGELDQALAVEVQVVNGVASLKGDVSSVTSSLTAQSDTAAQTEQISLEEAKEVVKAWDASWKDIVLDDQARFAIRKRLFQLTGNLIPDAKFGAARTVKHILTLAAKPPQVQRLADVLESRDDVQQLSNVRVHSRKIGPIDKEREVGRWKVIEEELRKRDLPITGTAGLSKNKERDWIIGRY